ncbi:MAG: hypothetical protein KDF56_06790 [Ottowia sp.]|nr:hypothetical protein [Ottowia sp.]
MLATGCAQIQMGAPVPSVDNMQLARASGMPLVALGSFKPAPGVAASLDQGVSVRTNTVYSPYDHSFAKYLKEALAVDLAAAGLLDPASRRTIEADLTDSRLDVPSGQAEGSVAARFSVTREGARMFDKELRASAQWEAPFVGAEAIPAALNQYGLLYRKLVRQLLEDREFQAALRR